MVKYNVEPTSAETTVKAKAEALRIHFKNVVNVAAAIKHMTLKRAKEYLGNVLEMKEAVAMKQHKKGRGRHAQGKNVSAPGSQAGWPRNATKEMLALLKNAEASATSKGLDNDSELLVSSIVCNQAPKGRRRTYRAHGRIGPYKSTPAHVNLVLKQKEKRVVKTKTSTPTVRKLKAAARKYIKVGGGDE